MHQIEDQLAVERRWLKLVASEASKDEVIRLEVDLERFRACVRHGAGEGRSALARMAVAGMSLSVRCEVVQGALVGARGRASRVARSGEFGDAPEGCGLTWRRLLLRQTSEAVVTLSSSIARAASRASRCERAQRLAGFGRLCRRRRQSQARG